ncbi:MAG: cobalt ECF transporter S component CbiM [Methanobacteriaceae archaeon]|nr:cobalt ECF transporter S component CbiM [Methanobacteriaceae archaeon]
MHIMEGFLPWQWCILWYAISLPVIIYGITRIKKVADELPESKPLLAVSGAFIFILSSLKMPSVTGSCSHPTGNGLGAILFGPWITSVMAAIVLIFQALLLAHGGLTTLGANIFSMGIIGPVFAWLTYKGSLKLNLPTSIAVFLAAFIGDVMTYVTTSFQLALAFPIPNVMIATSKFMLIFAYTQIPLGIAEGLLTVVVFENILKLKPDITEKLSLLIRKPTNVGD